MASGRDQENWQEDRLMIFVSTESGLRTVYEEFARMRLANLDPPHSLALSRL